MDFKRIDDLVQKYKTYVVINKLFPLELFIERFL